MMTLAFAPTAEDLNALYFDIPSNMALRDLANHAFLTAEDADEEDDETEEDDEDGEDEDDDGDDLDGDDFGDDEDDSEDEDEDDGDADEDDDVVPAKEA